jgi:hypothetical protein
MEVPMSQRHRSQDSAPMPKMEARAHAHNERHRIHSELHAVAVQVSSGYEPDEVHEPGRAWVPEHHHDSVKAKKLAAGRPARHWKVKAWKRRTAVRKAKAMQFRLAAEQA